MNALGYPFFPNSPDSESMLQDSPVRQGFQHFPQTFVAPIKIGDMGAELTLRDDSGMTQFLQAVYNGFSRFASDNVAVKGHFIPKEDLNLCSSVWLMSNSFINISPKIFWGSLKNSISRKIN